MFAQFYHKFGFPGFIQEIFQIIEKTEEKVNFFKKRI